VRNEKNEILHEQLMEKNADAESSPSQPREPSKLNSILAKRYPKLTEKERAAMETDLLRYFEVAFDIVSGPDAASLTLSKPLPTIKERSNVHLKK
jgi:hypothetical protein